MRSSDPDSLHDLLQTILEEYPKPADIYNTACNEEPEDYEISVWKYRLPARRYLLRKET